MRCLDSVCYLRVESGMPSCSPQIFNIDEYTAFQSVIINVVFSVFMILLTRYVRCCGLWPYGYTVEILYHSRDARW